MSLADDPTVAPGPAERDPDRPLLVIDLSGRRSRPPVASPTPDEVTARIPVRPADPPAARPEEPIGSPAGGTGPPVRQRDEPDEPPTRPIRAAPDEPATEALFGAEPATEPIRVAAPQPATVSILATDDESVTQAISVPTTERVTQPVEAPAAPAPAKARVRARARVYPRRRRRTGTVAGHRRRRDRTSLRRWEAVAWIAAAGVIAVMAGFVVRSAPMAKPLSPASAPARAAVAAAPTPVNCVLQACLRHYPPGPPTRVRIPAIHVDSALESLSLGANRVLNAPDRYDEAGWYAAGVVPGNDGPAVIAGHVDSTAGPAVFFSLRNLVPGDVVSVERGGIWVDFTVTQVEEYPKNTFPTDQVYRDTPDPELRVITCGGDFDTVHGRYYDNVVVYAILA